MKDVSQSLRGPLQDWSYGDENGVICWFRIYVHCCVSYRVSYLHHSVSPESTALLSQSRGGRELFAPVVLKFETKSTRLLGGRFVLER